MTVTFFGHRNTPEHIKNSLEITISNLIENQNANIFLVGNQGGFDNMSNSILFKLKEKYPHIKHYTILAYMPTKNNENNCNKNTIFPEDVAISHPKFAISKRNDWMLKNSDIVICYITHSDGGAAKYCEKAKKQGKLVINIAGK